MNFKKPALYIMTNKFNGTLYVGVTSNLIRRVFEHKNGSGSEFCSKYKCTILVWYYFFETMEDAIHTEKLLKRGRRERKVKLIKALNPSWDDLYSQLSQ